MWRDLERICGALELPFVQPSPFPQNTLLAARVAMVALAQGLGRGLLPRGLSRRIRRGPQYRRAGDDRRRARRARPERRGRCMQQAQGDAVKTSLRAQTEEAQRLGIFGAPSFRHRRTANCSGATTGWKRRSIGQSVRPAGCAGSRQRPALRPASSQIGEAADDAGRRRKLQRMEDRRDVGGVFQPQLDVGAEVRGEPDHGARGRVIQQAAQAHDFRHDDQQHAPARRPWRRRSWWRRTTRQRTSRARPDRNRATAIPARGCRWRARCRRPASRRSGRKKITMMRPNMDQSVINPSWPWRAAPCVRAPTASPSRS